MKSKPLCLALVLLACSQVGSERDKSAQPIFKGTPLPEDRALAAPAVAIVARTPVEKDGVVEFVDTPLGSGTLLAPDMVLTAAHVALPPFALKPCPPDMDCPPPPVIDDLVVVRPGTGTGSFRRKIELPFVHEMYVHDAVPPQGRPPQVDLAVLHLDEPIPEPSDIEMPGLVCGPQELPNPTECVCGLLHEIRIGSKQLVPRPLLNSAVFPLGGAHRQNPTLNPIYMLLLPNAGADQSLQFGDSGCGCFELEPGSDPPRSNNRLAYVVQGGPQGGIGADAPPTTATRLAAFNLCDWIEQAQNKLLHAIFVDTLRDDKEPDIVRIAQGVGSETRLILDRSKPGLGDLSFPVDVAGLTRITAGAVGNFTGTGQALALLADGDIVTRAFDTGPEPSVNGIPDTQYRMLSKSRINGDGLDDLVYPVRRPRSFANRRRAALCGA